MARKGYTRTSNPQVREMTPADLEPARWVIYRAYFEALLELYGPEAASQYELRSPDFMALYLRRDPHGNFVAVTEDGSLAGCLFCFVWGEVGWFGSLAVSPEWQGTGIGQQLTQRAVDYLRERGCRLIGLETWPTAPRTRHLYTKLGFQPRELTYKLMGTAAPSSAAQASAGATAKSSPSGRQTVNQPNRALHWVRAGDPAGLASALDLMDQVTEGLHRAQPTEPVVSYRAEVRVAVVSGWAELLICHGDPEAGQSAGFAVCYTRKPSGDPVAALDVRLLVVAPPVPECGGNGAAETLSLLLGACERRARVLGIEHVVCDVNQRYERALSLLQARGYRPIYELIRMELPTAGDDGTVPPISQANLPAPISPLIHCARWAG